MMIFSGSVKETIGTFSEYTGDYHVSDLLQVENWHERDPILLTDKVDDRFESFFNLK